MTPSLYSASIADIGKPVAEKIKKPRSEKQIAAFEKAREALKLKKEQKKVPEAPIKDEVKIEVPPETPKEEKIETPITSETPKVEALEKIEAPKEVTAPVKKAKKVKVEAQTQTDENPPLWFKNYVIGVKEEQAKINNSKIPKKQVRIEANDIAQKQWQQPVTRERVQNSVNNHMQKMYSMVFPNRKLY